MNDNTQGTFTPDAATIEFVLKQLAESGIHYKGCSWLTTHENVEWDGEKFVAENVVAERSERQGYKATLIDQLRPQDGKTYRGLMVIEDNQGRDKIGDVVVEIRLDPTDGRYKVHVENEQVFSDKVNYELLPRATRSSLENDRQSLKRRTIDLPGGGRSNPRRIAGLRIAQHSMNPNWGPNLNPDEFMDVFDYAETTDMMGQSTLLRAMKHYPAVIADEIYKQMRDPDRRKMPK